MFEFCYRSQASPDLANLHGDEEVLPVAISEEIAARLIKLSLVQVLDADKPGICEQSLC